MSGLFPVVVLNMQDSNIQFVLHATAVKYECPLHKMSRTDISSGSDVIDLSSCCFLRPFGLFYLI